MQHFWEEVCYCRGGEVLNRQYRSLGGIYSDLFFHTERCRGAVILSEHSGIPPAHEPVYLLWQTKKPFYGLSCSLSILAHSFFSCLSSMKHTSVIWVFVVNMAVITSQNPALHHLCFTQTHTQSVCEWNECCTIVCFFEEREPLLNGIATPLDLLASFLPFPSLILLLSSRTCYGYADALLWA